MEDFISGLLIGAIIAVGIALGLSNYTIRPDDIVKVSTKCERNGGLREALITGTGYYKISCADGAGFSIGKG
jgi:hypothetical protein